VTLDLRATASQLHRRATIEESLTRIGGVLDELTADLDAAAVDGPIDPGGELRVAVRAVLGTALRFDDFDMWLTSGHDPRWVVRVRHRPPELTATLCRTAEPDAGPADGPPVPEGSAVVSQLAELLHAERSSR
jgi:hypothetical protein